MKNETMVIVLTILLALPIMAQAGVFEKLPDIAYDDPRGKSVILSPELAKYFDIKIPHVDWIPAAREVQLPFDKRCCRWTLNVIGLPRPGQLPPKYYLLVSDYVGDLYSEFDGKVKTLFEGKIMSTGGKDVWLFNTDGRLVKICNWKEGATPTAINQRQKKYLQLTRQIRRDLLWYIKRKGKIYD